MKEPISWPIVRGVLSQESRTRYWLSSFDIALCEEMKNDGFDVGLLFSARRSKREAIIPAAERIWPNALHLPKDLFLVDSRWPTYVWTINDVDVAEQLVADGARGIFSDDPGSLVGRLRS